VEGYSLDWSGVDGFERMVSMKYSTRKRKIYIGEYSPISVNESGKVTYGDVIRYARKLYKFSLEQVAILYGEIAQGKPVTGRHILRMEQNDSFFPNHPNRRWMLAQLLNVPAALLALVELEPAPSLDPPKKPIIVPAPNKHIDLEEYQNTLQLYWFHRDTETLEDGIRDIRLRIHKLHEHVLYVSTPQKQHMTRLLCGYQILLADIAKEQQCWTAANRYLANAIILAHEKNHPDLQVIALWRRMVFFDDLENGEATLDSFAPAKKLIEHVPSQLQGKILTTAATAQARIARDDKILTQALKCYDETGKLVGHPTDNDFMFSMAFDQERYLLDRAATFMAPVPKKLRAPQKAQDLLDKAAKEHYAGIQLVSAYRQAYSDLIQAKIYFDQGYDPVAITSAESVLATLQELGSGIYLDTIARLVSGLKERDPHNIEVANLELALMKFKQPYLFN
jgi:transcriptional regulator with XRE-family HTH domain